jgi:hypothetical protein
MIFTRYHLLGPLNNLKQTYHWQSIIDYCFLIRHNLLLHVTHVTTASAMFVPFLCNVAGLPHSHLQIVRNWITPSMMECGRQWYEGHNLCMNICFGMGVKQRGGGWIQHHGIGRPRVEIGIFQLKIKNGYLTLRQTFQD